MAARSLNKVQIIGNLTRDPELRYTAQGTPICIFGVATNRAYKKTGSDEVIEETEFHNVVAWGKLAELCNQLLHKGWKVFIEGRLRTRSWEDGETNKRMFRTEIVALEMIVLGAPRSARVPEVEEGGEVPVGEEPEVSESSGKVAPTEDRGKETDQVAQAEQEIPF